MKTLTDLLILERSFKINPLFSFSSNLNMAGVKIFQPFHVIPFFFSHSICFRWRIVLLNLFYIIWVIGFLFTVKNFQSIYNFSWRFLVLFTLIIKSLEFSLFSLIQCALMLAKQLINTWVFNLLLHVNIHNTNQLYTHSQIDVWH